MTSQQCLSLTKSLSRLTVTLVIACACGCENVGGLCASMCATVEEGLLCVSVSVRDLLGRHAACFSSVSDEDGVIFQSQERCVTMLCFYVLCFQAVLSLSHSFITRLHPFFILHLTLSQNLLLSYVT